MQKIPFMLKINTKYSYRTKAANGKCRMSFANQIPSFHPLNKSNLIKQKAKRMNS